MYPFVQSNVEERLLEFEYRQVHVGAVISEKPHTEKQMLPCELKYAD
jgi:hypothetical protein